jgi:molybdopterin-guanine dinucleotide biosynthesis protein B
MKLSNRPLVLGFYGNSSSGKTTLIERLLVELKHNKYRIAVIKVSGHPVSLDENGKDTERFSRAGANPVVLASSTSTTYLVNKSCEEAEIVSHLQHVAQLDFIFIEGSRDKKIPKIRLDERAIRDNTLLKYDGNFVKLLDFITQLLEKEK